MSLFTPLRRLGLSVVALGASALIVTGCSSSTAGNPLGLGTGGNSSGVGVNSAGNGGASHSGPANSGAANSGAANSSAVAPGNAATSAASNPTVVSSGPAASVSAGGGGSNAAFCKQLSTLGTDLSSSASDPTGAKAAAAKYQELANAAPSEIKPDLQKLADYLNSLADGKAPDPSTTADLSGTVQRIVKYLTTACI